jgi:hypothetical protein
MSAAAPTGNQDVKPQSDGGTPQANVSFYPQVATDSLLGVVKADGTTITIEDGVISGVPGALHNSDGPPATPAFVQAPSGGGDSLAFSTLSRPTICSSSPLSPKAQSARSRSCLSRTGAHTCGY